MNIWLRIKRLSLSQLTQLGFLFLKNPLLIWPTFQATKRTMALCDGLFGKSHHKSNQANAFRHALWNILICKNVLKRTKTTQKAVIWAQKMTHLYEKVTQNPLLDEKMDLHNNEIGQMLFLKVFDKKEAEIIQILEKEVEKAQKIDKIEDFELATNSLVYLEDKYTTATK
ncbi:DUF6973 domain-containing protein [Ulvibacter litoralis]|uniref:DUF6973 domain-containing protein n=1 Tax=Ulvibacter litoralis TaxID=227084 RepID=A0A1G7D3L3_9FLAO|nr:hypothetical protein [Ulvibacter litoralis]GHC44970.1 hypothetical protein GCM10008083_04530 [Ulvibacter litoralis]SDE46192.1 hypothetical protein SAMN05421855_101752 [Ulvibacter litoralis]